MGLAAAELARGITAERRPIDLGAVLLRTEADDQQPVGIEPGGRGQRQGGERLALEPLARGGARHQIGRAAADGLCDSGGESQIIADEENDVAVADRAERPECDRDTVRHKSRFPKVRIGACGGTRAAATLPVYPLMRRTQRDPPAAKPPELKCPRVIDIGGRARCRGA